MLENVFRYTLNFEICKNIHQFGWGLAIFLEIAFIILETEFVNKELIQNKLSQLHTKLFFYTQKSNHGFLKCKFDNSYKKSNERK